MGYEYLLTLFKVLIGLINPQRLVVAALIAFGIFLVWVILALICSFQRKFYTKSLKLYNLLKNDKISTNQANLVDKFSNKISSGFAHGWKCFSQAESGKPSDYISRTEALDSEVSGGVFNQGKSLMKTYIWITTILLLFINFAFHGGDNAITFMLLTECVVLPLVYFIVMRVFYYLYTTVRQQLYKLDVECFYDLVEVLDENFQKQPKAPVVQVIEKAVEPVEKTVPVAEPFEEEQSERVEEASDKQEEVEENFENETEQSESENFELEEKEDSPEDALDKFDVFKKKNINVKELVNEVPESSQSLPFINVDSDYVIKDDEDSVTSKRVSAADNGSTVLGGMMQDMSSVKKVKEAEEQEQTEVNETDSEEKIENQEISSEEDSENNTNNDVQDEEENKDESVELENTLSLGEDEPSQDEEVSTVNDKTLEIVDEEISNNFGEAPQEIEDKSEVAVSEESEKDKLASIVGNYKSAKPKLGSGGVVIERNAPITRRNSKPKSVEIKEISSENVEKDSFNGNAGAFENYSNYQNNLGAYNDVYSNQNYLGQSYAPNTGFDQPVGFGQTNYGYPPVQGNYGFDANPYANYAPNGAGFGSYGPVGMEQSMQTNFNQPTSDGKIERRKSVPKTKTQTKTETVKKAQTSKSKIKENEEMADDGEKRRGRPKKQVFDDEVTINSDKEFNEVLARAEKLMRKSEEGLSASQSKRIEKELKMLMDAMNKYKEKK